jgi:tyrosinase
MAQTTFTAFTDHLENGPHGEVHVEVGTVNGVREAMADIRVSPADPIFWLHHAQIDRLWSLWQVQNPGQNPTLSGANAVMDPWPETATQLRSISALGYSYQ